MRITLLALIAGAVCCGPAQHSSTSDPVAVAPAPAKQQVTPTTSSTTPDSKATPASVPMRASWYCYRLWDATNPGNETTGCARSEDTCGRQRWELARAMRDQYGMTIETELCSPHSRVACFGYRLQLEEDDQTSCHPTMDECEKMRSENSDRSGVTDLSECAEQS